MKTFKIIFSSIICLFFILIAIGSSEKEKKTSFKNCDELLAYTKNLSYSTLVTEWGKGEIGKPWDASAVGEFDMKINVTWTNIKCKGKPIKITFNNNNFGLEDAYDKSPGTFDGVFCDDY